MDWLSGLLKNKNEDGSLQIMYTIHGGKDIPEQELHHLDGHKGQKPVRIGNGCGIPFHSSPSSTTDLFSFACSAADHIQLDIYGELMDAIYLSQKMSKPLSYDNWLLVRELVDYVCTLVDKPDLSIWEVRGAQQNFTYSKVNLVFLVVVAT